MARRGTLGLAVEAVAFLVLVGALLTLAGFGVGVAELVVSTALVLAGLTALVRRHRRVVGRDLTA